MENFKKEASNSAKRHADNSGYHAEPWPLKIAKALSDGSTLLKIYTNNTT